ncbi:MAG: hypothetical protein KDB14_33115 [Planctomycetales bacterium]|nr:hypothetical protein [Planctomycetales bacterium]
MLLIAATLFTALFALPDFAIADGYSRREKREAQRAVLKVLDEARAKDLITPAQRFRIGLTLRFKPEVCCGLLESIAPEVAALEGQDPSKFGKADNGRLGSAGGLYKLDIDQLEQLLQLILKYLPQILEIILDLFAQDVMAPVPLMPIGPGSLSLAA